MKSSRVTARGGLLAAVFLAPLALALGPHEILLLANQNAPRSVELAQAYAGLRQIPACNLVLLDLPVPVPAEITPADFIRLVLEPARAASRERGVEDHVLAWVYSSDFPIRITASPPLSLLGLTFLKGRLPNPDQVARGTYGSPLYAGPDDPRQAGFPPQSLDVQRAWLGHDMPLPSMMLGYTGPHGNTHEEILDCLRNGARSDRSHPDATVCIVTNSDIRSSCRQWELPAVVRELTALGLTPVVTNAYPAGSNQPPELIGLMTGTAEIPERVMRGIRFLPGAIADNLTSFGAALDNDSQMKITEWIRAGATAAAGTVTEPMALWPKFPHARIFTYPAAGCTLLESYYQALRCPLQSLIIGDPLAAPWAPGSTLTLQGLPQEGLTTRRTVRAVIETRGGEVFNRFLFLLDGRPLQPLGRSPQTDLEPAALTRGLHNLRVVAYKVGSVRSQIFCETQFEVP